MAYPPQFGGTTPESQDPNRLYSNVYNLDQLDVLVEDNPSNPQFFSVVGLPQQLSYGKTYFTIAFNDPEGSPYRLREGSGLLFEFKDAGGIVVFSDLTTYEDVNGAAVAYVWIKKDPLRTFDELEEGRGSLTIVGELENVSPQYQNVYNVRLTVPIDIRTDLPNNTPILFQSSSRIQESLVISESVEFDANSETYKRSILNVSASNLDTFGGQVKFLELSYNENESSADQFRFLTEYEISGSGEEFEISSSASTGLNPVSNFYKMPMPREVRRGSNIVFRLRFKNGSGQVAQDPSIGQDVILSASATFQGTPLVIEKDDNLMTGSVSVGTGVGKGFKMSGESSAYIASADYRGFTSASAGSGSGIILFSGSVFGDITDDYQNGGVGFEVVSDSSSFLRFRSNPSELDIRADAFFVGSTATQFISASTGIIEISSSKFHLEPDGDVTLAGTITAEAGSIGGFLIEEGKLTAGTNNSAMTMSGADRLLRFGSGSSFSTDNVDGILIGQDSDGVYKFAVGQPNSYIVFDGQTVSIKSDDLVVTASNFTIDSNEFKLATSTVFISSSGVGEIGLGSPIPTGISAAGNKGFFVDGNGNVLIGNSTASRIQFDGTDLTLSSSKFYLGSVSQYISGALGNIEISSSNFHLDNTGNVTLAGTVTANAGTLGGFDISQDAITSTNFFISGAATDNEYFISASSGPSQFFNVRASGDVTASSLLLTGGQVAGNTVTRDRISFEKNWAISASDNPVEYFISASRFQVSQQGDVTGSQVLFTGGDIGGATIDENSFAFGDISKISASSNPVEIFISSSRFKVKHDGQVTGSEFLFGDKAGGNFAQFTGDTLTVEGDISVNSIKSPAQIAGAAATNENASASISAGGHATFKSASIGGFVVNPISIQDSNSNLVLNASGQITASAVSMSGTVTATSGQIGGFAIGNDLSSNAGTLNLKGASGQITASAVSMSGTITATSGQIGGFAIADDLSSNLGTLKLKGASGQITASNALLSGKLLASDIIATGSGNIGGFSIGANLISASSGLLQLNSSGQITASAVSMSGNITAESGQIGGFAIGDDLSSNAGTLKLKGASGQITASDALLSGNLFASNLTATGSGIIGGFSIGENLISASTGLLQLNSSGQITASAVSMSGIISAEGGDVGGFSINQTSISSTNNNLILKSSGQITASAISMSGTVTAESGQIGGFVISEEKIQTSDGTSLVLNSAGQITGSNILFSGGTITSDVTIQGDLAASSISTPAGGSPKAIIDARGFAKFVSASIGGLDISTTFLSASNLVFRSSDGGKIALGTTEANETFGAHNTGVILSGSGDFQVVRGLNKYLIITGSTLDLQTDTATISGSSIVLGSPSFFLGDETNFVSGSTGNIEISSSGFHLKPTGDAILSGSITANDGTIGGFTINQTQITDTNGDLVLKSTGEITASAVSMSGTITADSGLIGGFDLANNKISNTGGPGDGSTIEIVVTVVDSGGNKFALDGVVTATKILLAGNTYSFTQNDDSNDNHPFRFSETENGTHGGGDPYTVGVTVNGTPGVSGAYTRITPTRDTPLLYYYCANHGGMGGSATVTTDSLALELQGNTGEITGSRFLFTGGTISGSDIQITVGTASLISDTGVEISGSNFHLLKGNITASNVDLSGKIAATSGDIGGFSIDASTISSSNNSLILKDSGQITGSDVLFNNGVVGGFELGSNLISSSNGKLILKSSGEITASAVSMSGIISAVGGDIGGFSIDGTSISSINGNIVLTSNGTITASDAFLGGDLRASNLIATGSGTIGGWTISETKITSSNLIIDSAGSIETADYSSNVRGWRISSENNGTAEFENIRIRGTLKSTVFEKETINAVGGQLLIANSTVLTGSGVTATESTMSVVNVTGFSGSYDGAAGSNEIVMLKKQTSNGFATEYIQVQSSSRDFPASNTNLTGKLYVLRGYSGSLSTDNDFVGDLATQAQSYEPGTVLVSTGRINTGYIRANSNPNDTSTPYIDIVERTGSGVYDVQHKLRLGDLSGLSSGLVGSSPGFGLFSENVFLTGKITATSGQVGGFAITGNTITSSENLLVLKSSGQITGSRVLLDGGKIGGFTLTDNAISSSDGSLVLKSSGQITASSVSMSGDIVATNITAVQTGIIGGFELGSNLISASSGLLQLNSSGQITASAVSMSGNITAESGQIGGFAIGDDLSSNAGTLRLKGASGQITASAVSMSGTITAESGLIGGFEIGSSTISSPAGVLNLNSQGQITASAVSMSGVVTATSGQIGGFAIGTDLTSNAGTLNLKGSSGQITASAVSMSGIISATGGDIGGFSIDNNAVSSTNSNLILKSSGQITASAMSMSGVVTAQSGQIGGFAIGEDLSSNSGQLNLKGASGQITASNALLSGKLFASDIVATGSGIIGGFSIGENLISASSGLLQLNSSGQITASAVSMSGIISAQGGDIGGFSIDGTSVSSTNNNLILKSSGQITASAVSMSGDIVANNITAVGTGVIGGFELTSTQLNSANDNLILKSSGQITASAVSMSGTVTATAGLIGGFTIDADEIKSTNIIIDSANERITVGSQNDVRIQGGGTDNFIAMGDKLEGFTDEGSSTEGILIGMDGSNPQAEFVQSEDNYFIFDNGVDIRSDTIKASGSNIILEAPRFYLGGDAQFISGSNGNIEISSSNFHLSSSGDVTMAGTITATGGTVGGFNIGDDLSSTAGTLSLKGASGQITASAVSMSGVIMANQGNIGGFSIDSGKIIYTDTFELDATATNNQYVISSSTFKLGADGDLTASNALFSSVRIIGGAEDNSVIGEDLNIPSFVGGGDLHSILNSKGSFLGGGTSNVISSSAGSSNIYNAIVGGSSGSISISSSFNFIGGGFQNTIRGPVEMQGTDISGNTMMKFSAIVGGDRNTIERRSFGSTIIGGRQNLITGVPVSSSIFLSNGNPTASVNRSSEDSLIAGGKDNTLFDARQSIIVGGDGNVLSGSVNSLIGGGDTNLLYRSPHSMILGGKQNRLWHNDNTDTQIIGKNLVGGGESNFLYNSAQSSIVGGFKNVITGSFGSAILGGAFNQLTASHGSVILGGGYTTVALNKPTDFGHPMIGRGNYLHYSSASFVGGGIYNNLGYSFHAALVGGEFNFIDHSDVSFIGGGAHNVLTSSYSSSIVGGGSNRLYQADVSFIGGGSHNVVSESNFVAIAGGTNNTIQADSSDSAIVGGASNAIMLDSPAGFVGGGRSNVISGSSIASVIGGGVSNSLFHASFSGILGGSDNTISQSEYSLIGGGEDNSIVSSSRSGILAGDYNTITASMYSFILGGENNRMSASEYSTAVGGKDNTLGPENVGSGSIKFSQILGGDSNELKGVFSSTIVGGRLNSIRETSENSLILGGLAGNITDVSKESIIAAGVANTITRGDRTAVIVGNNNSVSASTLSAIVAGRINKIHSSDRAAIIGASNQDIIHSTNATALGGAGIIKFSETSVGINSAVIGHSTGVIGAGGSTITGSKYAFAAGQNNTIQRGSSFSFIGGGLANEIWGAYRQPNLGAGKSFTGWTVLQDSTLTTEAKEVAGIYSNIVGGNNNDVVSSSYSFIGAGNGVVISGSEYSAIVMGDGGSINQRQRIWHAAHSFIGGGYYSRIQGSPFSFVGGGDSNQISASRQLNNQQHSNVIVGGADNRMENGPNVEGYVRTLFGSELTISPSVLVHASILGGDANIIYGAGSARSSIVGGEHNEIGGTPPSPDFTYTGPGGGHNAIVNGVNNAIGPGAYNIIGSGQNNEIISSSYHTGTDNAKDYNSILNGNTNLIRNVFAEGLTIDKQPSGSSMRYNAILSGRRNYIYAQGESNDTSFNTIGGGLDQTIKDSTYSTILGGYNNVISSSTYGMIFGTANTMTGDNYSTILGRNNTNNFEDAHVLGNGLTATQDDTTFVDNLIVDGVLSKGSGTFRITHPNPAMSASTWLQHSFVESPTRGDNIYRWKVELTGSSYGFKLPEYYKHLNENDQIWVNPVEHFGRAYGVVDSQQHILTVTADTTGSYNVLLIGTRKDQVAMENFEGVEVTKSLIERSLN